MGGGFVGSGKSAQAVRAWVAHAGPLQSAALLTGETGTGKGLVARLLHEVSGRAEQPFVHVDLATLGEELVASELFGHERGAFTGAHHAKRGRLEAAGQGTLFLDEIGELSLRNQGRLLRVLQERVFERVGGSRTLPLRARVIAATNLPLEVAVREGRFRRDLFHRLDVLRLELPPLRERLEDLPELAEALAQEIGAAHGIRPPSLEPCALECLAQERWPGNVRELRNLLERTIVWGAPGALHAEQLQGSAAWVARDAPSGAELEETLRETGGNVARAARRLGVPRTTLRRRIAAARLGHLIPRD